MKTYTVRGRATTDYEQAALWANEHELESQNPLYQEPILEVQQPAQYIMHVPHEDHGAVYYDFKEDVESAVTCARLLNTIKSRLQPVTVRVDIKTMEVQL